MIEGFFLTEHEEKYFVNKNKRNGKGETVITLGDRKSTNHNWRVKYQANQEIIL